jgi:hypothetical protein
LVGHYVNYRKPVSPTMQELLPEADFRLFAVSVRFPRDLARQVTLEAIQEGVYAVRHFTGVIRLIVIHQLPRQEHNAMLHLFSARQELVEYGARHYRPYSGDTSTLLYKLLVRYHKEGLPMIPLTLEELHRETVEEILKNTPPEKLLEGLSADDVLKALTPEVRAALARRLKEAETPAQDE